MMEPLLTDEDHRRWALLERTARAWAATPGHHRRVDRARAILSTFANGCRAAGVGWRVAWSAGKDSTALVHLAATMGPVAAVSEKDDLDFPGEEKYIGDLAAAWGVDLSIVRPPFALQEWLAAQAPTLLPGADIHRKAAELSRVAFYGVLDTHWRDHGQYGVALGLRGAESRGRMAHRATHGTIYRTGAGRHWAQPIADWQDLDVYAYLLAHDVPLLPLYRAVRLHTHPAQVRKSWWLPGAQAQRGGTIWLRTYYPSLYRRLTELVPLFSTTA